MERRIRERHWWEEFKDLFAVRSNERNGIIILASICFVCIGWVVYEQALAPDQVQDLSAFEMAYVEMQAARSAAQGSSIDRRQGSERQAVDRGVHAFRFDPNHLPVEQWVLLGLSERQAAAVHRYEASGGHFRTKGDLARMRVVPPDLFEQWEPFILLPDSLERNASDARSERTWPEEVVREGSDRNSSFSKDLRVEINSADTLLLTQVRGIGPAFARSIVKFRDKLGGFHSLDQLREVYILRDKPEAVSSIQQQILLDTLMVRKIPVNTCAADAIAKHPYGNWKVANALVAYRKQHGSFSRVADVRNCALVTDSIYQRLAPYLTVE